VIGSTTPDGGYADERPLTPQELNRRAIVALWDLRCITCPHADGLCGR